MPDPTTPDPTTPASKPANMPATMNEEQLDQALEELIVYQRKRVLDFARRLQPDLTEDDIWNPHDIAVLRGHPEWNYEDGILAGYRSAQMSLRARLRRGA